LILLYLTHITHTLLIERYQLPTSGGAIRTLSLKSGYKMVFNGRYIGTHHQASNIRPRKDIDWLANLRNFFSIRDAPRGIIFPEKPSSHRSTFLQNRLLCAVTMFLSNAIIEHQILNPNPAYFKPLDVFDFLPPKHKLITRFTEITSREALIRILLVLYHNWHSYALYTGFHDILAFVFVGLNIDTPGDWPPLFGSILEAYTLRRYWSHFWHRIIYRTYVGFAKFVASSLRFTGGGPLLGIWVNFFVFGFSGAIHVIASANIGFRCGFKEESAWYLMNLGAIMAEGLVLWYVKRIAAMPSSMVCKGMGYVWVYGFMLWSLPKMHFAKIICGPI
jgi:hypothetical protein